MSEWYRKMTGEWWKLGNDNDNVLKGDGSDQGIKGYGGNDIIYGYNGEDELFGGSGNDIIYGGNDNDEIQGDSGEDKLYGENGDDRIYGGAGNDEIYAGDLNDYATGNEGEDRLFGGWGNDTLEGGHDNDRISGGADNDILRGQHGDDIINGDHGNDFIEGGIGNDFLTGGEGEDTLNGGSGKDNVNGGRGNDRLVSSAGGDHYNGEEGHDDIIDFKDATQGAKVNLKTGVIADDGFNYSGTVENIENVEGSKFADKITGDDKNNKLYGKDGNDILEGGKGRDTFVYEAGNDTYYGYTRAALATNAQDEVGDKVDYSTAHTGISVVLELNVSGGDWFSNVFFNSYYKPAGADKDDIVGAGNDGRGGVDTLVEIEDIVGSNHNDTIRGSRVNNKLEGGAGNDTLSGNGGEDKLFGGDGNDTLDAGGSNTGGREEVIGGTGDDTLFVRNGLNSHYHGDAMDGKAGGYDKLSYQYATQGVDLNLAAETGHTGWFGDTLGIAWDNGYGHAHFVSGFEEIVGSNHNDKIIGSSKKEVIRGGNGDDVLDGAGGSEKITGGRGNDTVIAREGVNSHLHGDKEYANANEADFDTLDYSHATQGINVQMEYGQGNDWWGNFYGRAWDNGFGQQSYFSGFEKIIGSSHNDKIYGGSKDDTLEGGAGNDYLWGGGGLDHLVGGEGDDKLNSGGSLFHQRESIVGGSGSDTVIANSSGVNSHYHGDIWSPTELTKTVGHDVIDYSSADNGIHIDLDVGHWSGDFNLGIAWNNGFGAANFVTGFEEVIGSNHDDHIVGSSNGDVLRGGKGNDYIDSAGSNGTTRDAVIGGEGSDTVIARDSLVNSHYHGDIWNSNELRDPGGTDVIDYSNAANGVHLDLDIGHVWGGVYKLGVAWNNGFGKANFVTGFEKVIGSNHNDLLSGSYRDEIFQGGAGTDVMDGAGGKDVFVYTSLSDSTAANRDVINNFARGADKIDLTALGLDDVRTIQIDATFDPNDVVSISSDNVLSIKGQDFAVEVNTVFNLQLSVDDILF